MTDAMDEAREAAEVEHDVGAEAGAGERDEEAGATAADMSALRDLISRAHPDIIPELLRGSTLGELLDSLPAARDAYARVAEQLRAAESESIAPASVAGTPVPVPAGAAVRTPDAGAANLSPLGKIRAGLART